MEHRCQIFVTCRHPLVTTEPGLYTHHIILLWRRVLLPTYASVVLRMANEQCLHGKLFYPIRISIVLSIDWYKITANLANLASHDFTCKPHAMHTTLWCSSYSGGRGTHQVLICEVQCWRGHQKSCACAYVLFHCATHGKWAMSSWEVVLCHPHVHCVKYWLIQTHSKSS